MRSRHAWRGRLLRAPAAGALAAICATGLLATSGWLITRAAQRPPVFTLSIAIGAVQAFALGRGLARYLERLAVHDVSLKRLGDLRVHLFELLEPLVPGGLGPWGSGAVVAGFVSDAELVAEGFAKRVMLRIDVTASIAAGTALACLVQPTLGALVASGAAAVVLVALGSVALSRHAAEAEARLRSELADSVLDTLHAARELVAYEREDILHARLSTVRRQSIRTAWRRAIGVGAGRAAGILLAGAGLMAVVADGLALRDQGRLSGVMLAVVAFAALAVFDQVAGVAPVLGDLVASGAASRRLEALARIPQSAPEPAVARSPQPGPLSATLAGADVYLAAPVLTDVSLTVGPGRHVALIGPSGSGKSTALHALLHFVPLCAGTATLGDVEVSAMTREGLARHLGWMPDETHLFSASLADNLRIARPAATDEELDDVLDQVGLGGWLGGLPGGLATPLGVGGCTLSAGERQRVGMARALLSQGPVLLLDEPTAHLDPLTSPDVLAALLGAAGERSVLVVSHDPHVAHLVDAVVQLDEGRVVKFPGERP